MCRADGKAFQLKCSLHESSRKASSKPRITRGVYRLSWTNVEGIQVPRDAVKHHLRVKGDVPINS